MTPPTIRMRRAWRRYFETLTRSERALRRAERALGDVALAADRCPDDSVAVALRRESVAAALAVGRLRRRLTAVGIRPQGGHAMTHPSDLVHVYTRSQALADGVLVDVSRQASPTEMLGGFTVPMAVTAALWAAIESIPVSLQGIADVRGRLHDVLWMAACAARRSLAAAPPPRTRPGGESSRPLADSPASGGETARGNRGEGAVCFRMILPSAGVRARVVTLRLDVGPGDGGELVATIGFPEAF